MNIEYIEVAPPRVLLDLAWDEYLVILRVVSSGSGQGQSSIR